MGAAVHSQCHYIVHDSAEWRSHPYGVAFMLPSFSTRRDITSGDILVSNFNDWSNIQGIGTTIIKLTPNGLVAPAVSVGQAGHAAMLTTRSASIVSTSSFRS